jgi:energy-coupling factor transporter ATP-binding protein EcfA2
MMANTNDIATNYNQGEKAMVNTISRIEIKDFLVFKGEFSVDFCPGVNIFIGGNGSGKTTLLKMLYAALAEEKDVNTATTLKAQGKEVRGYSFIPMRSISWRDIAPQGVDARYSMTVSAIDDSGEIISTTTETSNDFISVTGQNGNPIALSQLPKELRVGKLNQGKSLLVKSLTYIPEFDLLKVVQNFKRELGLFINGNSDSHTQWLNGEILSQEQRTNGNLGRLIEDMIHLYCPDAASKSLFIRLFNIANAAQAFFTEKKAAVICDAIGNLLGEKGITFSGVEFSQDLQSFVFSNGVTALYEASGVRKFGLLWLLVKYHLIELAGGSMLFWDEPENSLNPELIPILVNILLELQNSGVQIFIATHSYDVARWFELNKKAENSLRYFNLCKTDSGIAADVADDYVSLSNSVIEDAGDALLQRVTEVAAEKAGVTLK